MPTKYKKHKWSAKIALSDGSEISWFKPTKKQLIEELDKSLEKDKWTLEQRVKIKSSIKQEY